MAPLRAEAAQIVFTGSPTTLSLPFFVTKKNWLGDLKVEEVYVTGDANAMRTLLSKNVDVTTRDWRENCWIFCRTSHEGRPAWAKPSGRRINSDELESDLKRDAAYERILLDIFCGELAPREWIDEAALAERYRTGRAGVRDALLRLALECLVERKPRLGTVVAAPDVFEFQQIFEPLRVTRRDARNSKRNAQCSLLATPSRRKPKRSRAPFANADRATTDAVWQLLACCDRRFRQSMAAAGAPKYVQHRCRRRDHHAAFEGDLQF